MALVSHFICNSMLTDYLDVTTINLMIMSFTPSNPDNPINRNAIPYRMEGIQKTTNRGKRLDKCETSSVYLHKYTGILRSILVYLEA